MSTITVPDPLPTPEEDSHKLKKAFQGWGTDEKAIIEILGHRTAAQRREISEAYAKLFNKSLVQSLQSELSGDFGKAMILWSLDPAQRDAKLANEALKRKSDRNACVIIEIACASSPDHLIAVRQAYCSLFNSSLEEDIAHHFAQQLPLRQLLIRLVSSYRYNGKHIDEALAQSEASKLYVATKVKELHRDDILDILSIRSKSHLQLVFDCYKQDYGKAIDEDIEANQSGDKLSSVLKAVVLCLRSPAKHFAEVIRTSVLGLGTDEDLLTRAIVTRAEIDMKDIKEEYKIRYNTTVNADVIGDTSGDYKNFLLTLVGCADS